MKPLVLSDGPVEFSPSMPDPGVVAAGGVVRA